MEITRLVTPNQYALDGDVEAIILHTTLGAYKGAVEWLMMSPEERKRRTGTASYSSANLVIGRLGEMSELARPNRGTWHAGRVSKPSQRAKDVLPKQLWGTLKNPNKHTLGLEFASGYDIDRDGVLETWEKLYTPQQVKACVFYILEVVEPKTGKRFGEHNILTHKDVTSYKPDLEIQRAMVIAELAKQRAGGSTEPAPEPTPGNVIISIKEGNREDVYKCTRTN